MWIDPTGTETVIPAKWGSITGTLSDQTDLQSALNDKVSSVVRVPGSGGKTRMASINTNPGYIEMQSNYYSGEGGTYTILQMLPETFTFSKKTRYEKKGSLDIDDDGTKITGIVTPTSSDMATNKSYVDTAVKEVYSYSETPTNKVYIDSNNVEHTIYSKMVAIDFTNAIDVPVGGGTVKGIPHNITNFDKLFETKTLYENHIIQGKGFVNYGFPAVNDTYLLFETADSTIKDAYIEYTKSS